MPKHRMHMLREPLHLVFQKSHPQKFDLFLSELSRAAEIQNSHRAIHSGKFVNNVGLSSPRLVRAGESFGKSSGKLSKDIITIAQ